MAHIKLDPNEVVVWNEVGSRGERFREAMRDRATEEVRLTGKMSEIRDADSETMLDAVQSDEVPISPNPLPPQSEAPQESDQSDKFAPK